VSSPPIPSRSAIASRTRAAIALVRRGEKPLALYVFAEDRAVIERVLASTTSGGAVVNNTVHHTDFTTLQPLSQAQERTNNFVVGWTAGLGFEYMLWGDVFVRGEWEYVKFMSVENTSVTMNNARAGIGYKF